MTLKTGNVYFVKDEFFEKVKDPFLKINYKETKRPHYYALEDKETGIFWFVPCSSKIEKFERIVQAKKVIKLINHGVKFTPTQPDAQKIKELIVEELR